MKARPKPPPFKLGFIWKTKFVVKEVIGNGAGKYARPMTLLVLLVRRRALLVLMTVAPSRTRSVSLNPWKVKLLTD